jgi:hypothetical protein
VVQQLPRTAVHGLVVILKHIGGTCINGTYAVVEHCDMQGCSVTKALLELPLSLIKPVGFHSRPIPFLTTLYLQADSASIVCKQTPTFSTHLTPTWQ